MSDWSIDDARVGYNVAYWSQGFYGISDQGEVTVSPDPLNPDSKIGLNELAKDMVKAGVNLPVLVRFPQILHHRSIACARPLIRRFKSMSTAKTICWFIPSR